MKLILGGSTTSWPGGNHCQWFEQHHLRWYFLRCFSKNNIFLCSIFQKKDPGSATSWPWRLDAIIANESDFAKANICFQEEKYFVRQFLQRLFGVANVICYSKIGQWASYLNPFCFLLKTCIANWRNRKTGDTQLNLFLVLVGLNSLVIDWFEGVAGGFDDAAGVLCRVPVPGGTSLFGELGRRSGRCQILRQTSTSCTASKENIILGLF